MSVLEIGLSPASSDSLASCFASGHALETIGDADPLFSALADASFEGLVITENGRVLDLNDRLARLMGFRRREVIGEPLLDFVAPESVSRVAEAHQAGRSLSYEFAFLRPDEIRVQVEGRTRSARIGNRVLLITTIQDSSDRRRAEEALLFSQERFALAMDAANDGLWDWHVPSGKGYFSPRYCSMLGYSSEELLPTYGTFLGLVHPDDRPRVEAHLDRCLTSGDGSLETEFRMRSRDGTWIWILSRGRVIDRASDGRPLRVMGTHTDVSDRRRAQDELKESEERLRQAVRVSRIGIFDHDHLTDTLYWSTEQRANHDLPAGESISHAKFLQLIHPEDRGHVEEGFRAACDPSGPGVFDGEYRVITAVGEIRWLATRSRTLFEGPPPHRRAARTIGAVLDFTEQKRAEERLSRARDELEVRVQERTQELQEAKRSAEATSEAKSRFLAVMSHEIRTPLNGVTSVLHLLDREGVNARQQRWIEMAKTSAGTLLRVINDILDFSKIEAGKLDLRPRPIQLAATLTYTVAPFAEKAAARHLPCLVHLDPDLPPVVEADPDRLAQILGNLLANALKFTESGSIRVQVRPLPRDGDRVPVRFEVIDTGIGISPEHQQLLFQPFSQVDNHCTRRHGGTGLGLGICRQLVDLMGGRIGVLSAGQTGSTFWFVIPFAIPSEGSPGEGSTPSSHNRPPQPLPPAHVLVAEDNDINQELLREILIDLGLTCDCVGDGAAAIEAVRTTSYDLVVMDCMMPGIDGYAATRSIRKGELLAGPQGSPVPRRIPIIALTANAMIGDREQCLLAGMDDYVSKPVNPGEIAAVLRRWLTVHSGVPSVPPDPPQS